jgi:type I restriction enzyme S subunit
MTAWREIAISELALEGKTGVAGGPFGSALGRKHYTAHGVPVIRGAQLSGSGRFSLDDLVFVSPEKADRHSGNLAYPGDVVVTQRGTLGQVGLIPRGRFDRFLLSQSQMKIAVDQRVADPEFVYFALRAPEVNQRLIAHATTSGVPHVNLGVLRAFQLPVPDVDTQRRIAALLSTFDKLIEINERRIELLEDLARSLYREWFVHFRFPGHESVKLKESELGAVPDNWSVRVLGDVAEAVRGRSYRRGDLAESGGLPFLNLKCVRRGGGFRHSGLKRYQGRYKDTQRTVPGDVLVAVTDMTQERRIVAQSFRMPDLDEPFGIPSLDLVLLRPEDGQMRLFVYAVLRYSSFADHLSQYANGANVLHLPVDRILEYQIAIPDDELLNRFTMAIGEILDHVELLEKQSRTFGSVRDLLLPRLVSGQLDISDIDLGVLAPTETE